jgi:hypothetical protein
MRTKLGRRTVGVMGAMSVFLGARLAAADMVGSFDGQLVARKLVQPIPAAATLTVTGSSVTGTIAVGGDPAPYAGAYLIHGSATTKRLKVSANLGGATFAWRAKILGDTLAGKARLKAPGARVSATLTLTLNQSTGNGSGCDAVFTQNQTFFVDQVLGDALSTCATCHVTAGQADATRFHVVTGDPLATARALAMLVDSADPTASRILEKPQAIVPHGGGQQLVPGSTQEQALVQWVTLVAGAHCN